MRPLIVIDNFDVGVTYDETSSISGSFSDIEGVDIISEPGVAKAQKEVTKIIDVPDNSSISHFLEWAIEPKQTGTRRYTYYLDTYNGQVLQSDDSGNMTVFRSLGGGVLPNNSQMVIMQDQLMLFPYKDGTSNKLASTYGWSTGENAYITASGSTITLSNLQDLSWLENAPGTIYLEQSPGVFQSYTVITYTDDRNLVLSSAYTGSLSGGMRGYYFRHYNNYYNPALNTETTINFNDKNPMFKPMLYKDSCVYIGDGDTIIKLNGYFEPFTQALSVIGFTIKKLLDYNGKVFIIGDETNNTQYGTGIPYIPEANSSIITWSGLVQQDESPGAIAIGIEEIIQAQGHILDGIIADNKLYLVIKTERQIVLALFNGSDFNTIITISKTLEQQYANILAAYRGALYMYISEGASKNYIYSLSAFGELQPKLIKVKNMGTKLPGPIGFLLGFNKTTSKTEKRGNLIVSVRGDGIYELKSNQDGNYQSFDDGTQVGPHMITKTYEISQMNFKNLLVGLGIMCKELIPSGCKIGIDYKLDNDTSWRAIGDFTSSNQEYIKNNINKRARRITLRIKFYTNVTSTGKLIELKVYGNIPNQ